MGGRTTLLINILKITQSNKRIVVEYSREWLLMILSKYIVFCRSHPNVYVPNLII